MDNDNLIKATSPSTKRPLSIGLVYRGLISKLEAAFKEITNPELPLHDQQTRQDKRQHGPRIYFTGPREPKIAEALLVLAKEEWHQGKDVYCPAVTEDEKLKGEGEDEPAWKAINEFNLGKCASVIVICPPRWRLCPILAAEIDQAEALGLPIEFRSATA